MRELERRGARVLVAPTIRLIPARSAALTAALKELTAGRFDWITLDERRDGRRPARPTRVTARRARTGRGDRRWHGGGVPSLGPPGSRPAAGNVHDPALARAFPRGSGRVLCARADIAPEGLEVALAEEGLGGRTESTPIGRSSPRHCRAKRGMPSAEARWTR